ncbi:MAG: WcbI family polysaccharide biosynthesis putative acetyltransferase [Methylocystis sp.]|uniref:WcbI family polysaccharide biosynthesis putative acetyltransferase n=1 Tax=Methylocystis sp. TaxID=1911079 RepID=UPI00394A39BB
MDSWLMLGNCQVYGLAASVRLLNPKVNINAISFFDFKKDSEKNNSEIHKYSRVIVNPIFLTTDGVDLSVARKLHVLPSIDFDAYHPDICYAYYNNSVLKGPLDSYHSMLILAAYELDVPKNKVRRIFADEIFQQCRFYDVWHLARDRMFTRFKRYNLDIIKCFVGWGRSDAFMYTTNHPKIRCLFDIARLYLIANDIEIFENDILPIDNLVNGPCYPIYPDIAERTGVRGSYLFKNTKQQFLTLDQFIEASFHVYGQFPRDRIKIDPLFKDRYERVKSVIKECIQ